MALVFVIMLLNNNIEIYMYLYIDKPGERNFKVFTVLKEIERFVVNVIDLLQLREPLLTWHVICISI